MSILHGFKLICLLPNLSCFGNGEISSFKISYMYVCLDYFDTIKHTFSLKDVYFALR